MLKRLCPGVYVEEVSVGVQTIADTATSTRIALLRNLAEGIRQSCGAAVPAWTDVDASDPGTQLVQLLAWIAEDLIYRSNTDIPERGREAAVRAAISLMALATPCPEESECLKRPSFFSGQLLDATTLQGDQDYHRAKLRRHNRALHGAGIVEGLGIHVDGGSGSDNWHVVVQPGLAIDSCGEEIALSCTAAISLPADVNEGYVGLRFFEYPCQTVPEIAPALGRPSWIEEACLLSVASNIGPAVVALGRVVRTAGTWAVDAAFVPPLARSWPG